MDLRLSVPSLLTEQMASQLVIQSRADIVPKPKLAGPAGVAIASIASVGGPHPTHAT